MFIFFHMHYRTWTSVCPCRPTSGYLTATWRSCSWAAPPSTSLWAGVRVEHHWWVLLAGPWNIRWYNWYGVYLWCFILLNCCKEKVFCRNKQLSGLLSWVYVTCPSHCPRLRICRESGRNGEERLLGQGGAVESFEKKGERCFILRQRQVRERELMSCPQTFNLILSACCHVFASQHAASTVSSRFYFAGHGTASSPQCLCTDACSINYFMSDFWETVQNQWIQFTIL